MISSTFTSGLGFVRSLLLSKQRWRGNRRMIRESYLALNYPFVALLRLLILSACLHGGSQQKDFAISFRCPS